MVNPTVVNKTKKHKSIFFGDYIFRKRNETDFTTLSEAQQKAIRNIEKYWIQRTKRTKNWKAQKHWDSNKETVSTRIGDKLFNYLKEIGSNNQKLDSYLCSETKKEEEVSN